MINPTPNAAHCPNCGEYHLKPTSTTRAGNIQWMCRVDRRTPSGKFGCGYSETPDRKVPMTSAERSRLSRARKKARDAEQKLQQEDDTD